MIDVRSILPSALLTDNYVVADFEVDTSHGDYGHPVHPDNQLLLACWKRPGERTQATWANEYGQDKLLAAIEAADLFVAHNSKYELGWLIRCGLDLRKVLAYCTKLGEYVLMGNLAAGDDLNAPRSTSLDDCCRRRGWPAKDPVTAIMIANKINPVRLPRPWLEGRCRQDVESTEALFIDQRRALLESNRLGVQLTRCVLTPMLAEAEMAGMRLDPNRTEAAYTAAETTRQAQSVLMDEITGGINWKSNKQIAEFLYNPVKPRQVVTETGDPVLNADGTPLMTRPGLGFKELRTPRGEVKRTPAGVRVLKDGTVKQTGNKPLTDQKTIAQLVVTNQAQRDFIEVRKALGKANAALVKSLQFFQGVCRERGGVFHAVFNQTNTATHRTSSTGIPLVFKMYEVEGEANDPKSAQFQNLPNEYKPLFVAGEGRLMAEWDGSQLEFRTAAQVSRDPQMVADILDADFDAHVTSAAAMHSVAYTDLLAGYRAKDPEALKWRTAAKPDTFGPLYGKSFGTPEQVRWIEEFRRRYAAFYEYSQNNVHKVLADKVLVLPWGMRYYWPYAKMHGSGYINCTTAVYNYPIQGFATAEIIPVAVAAFRRRVLEAEEAGDIKPGDVRILITVHDSLLCDIAESALEWWKEAARLAATTDVYAYLKNVYNYAFDLVPLGVGLNYGTHWADPANTEEEWDIYPDARRIKRK